MPTLRRRFPLLFAVFTLALLLVLSFARHAGAVPEAHVLRIDPRAGVANGAPVLTSVVEVVQFNSASEIMQRCSAASAGAASLDCISNEMEKPNAVASAFPFNEPNARMLVKVQGRDTLATLDGKATKWGESKEKGIGTAWLIAVDASAGMGSRYADARAIARQFVQFAMGPQDLMNIQIFDDRGVIQNSKWRSFAKEDRDALVNVLNAQPGNAPSHGGSKPLFNILKGVTLDGFNTLGNTQGPQEIPLMQVLVVLSNGAGRQDASSASPSADVFHQFVTKGRFPEDNTSSPKTPLPVVSIWLPTAGSIVNDALRNNDQQFMFALANPEIGGFFDIVRDGQGEAKGKRIIDIVEARFNAMYVAKWRVSCLNPTAEQSFSLEFQGTKPPIKGDSSFKDVPLGVDPSQWPLDVDVAKTRAEAEANPVFPGGTMKVYGSFCWGGETKRAESYFVPAGSKPDPSFNSNDIAAIKRAQTNLIAQNMRGAAKDANDAFVIFDVPDEDRILDGSGDNAVVRALVVDNNANRASGHDEKTILTLKGQKKPFNILLIIGIAGGVIVIILLVLVLLRGGGGKRRSRGAPPSPVVAGGGGYGPPQGGGYPQQPPGPGPGAYGAPPPQQPPHQQQQQYAPQPAYVPAAAPVAAPSPVAGAVMQVRCPSCGSSTMATPGQPSVCFSCGQPLPAEVTGGGGGVNAPTFPLTGGLPAHPLEPPPNPYGVGGTASAAILSGTSGNYTIRPGAEVRVGRDPALCPVTLTEPRVSGVHSTLKFENAQLWVRDETSNNGTYVAGSRINPGTWVPVPAGSQLRFGPVEFTVRLDS